jgi:hypothetical protein
MIKMKNSYSRVISDEILPIQTNSICDDFKHMEYDIKCQICLNVVYPEPACCGICHKLFCKSCINDWRKKRDRCPNDHKFKEKKMNPLEKNLLEGIMLNCPNLYLGCTKNIKYGNYLKHLDSECEFTIFNCNGCNLVDTKRIIMMHVNLCEEVDDICTYCSLDIKRKYLSDHIQNCNERILECDDCHKFFKKIEIENHKNNCEERTIMCFYCKKEMKKKLELFHSKDICFSQILKTLKEKDYMISKLEAENKYLKSKMNL